MGKMVRRVQRKKVQVCRAAGHLVRSPAEECQRGERKDWEDAACPVCLEYPHNAVLLLCSSYSNGCRPYMCATSDRYSNCLEQYRKAYTKPVEDEDVSEADEAAGLADVMELLPCPLCRGRVRGWTVVDGARAHLNRKKRGCMHDDCTFAGSYKRLRRHVKGDHPSARPGAVDPALREKWKRLERERDMEDVLSTISTSMPGSIVLGDYVIDGGFHRLFRDVAVADDVVDLHGDGGGSRSHVHRILRNLPFFDEVDDDDDDDDDDDSDGVGEGSAIVGQGRQRVPVRLRRRRRRRQSRRLILSLE